MLQTEPCTVVGNWKLEKQLGAGTFGTVTLWTNGVCKFHKDSTFQQY